MVNLSSYEGETRFGMLFSEQMDTGKTTSLLVLASGQGIPSQQSHLMLSGGDGHTSGTTT